LEICAEAGGQSLGLEQAGFSHVAAVEIDVDACETLQHNRSEWNVIPQDIHGFNGAKYRGKVDLFVGGVPCPPFSIAGNQLGADDERDLFPRGLELITACEPRAIMFENVRGLASTRFANYLKQLRDQLHLLKYKTDWRLLIASDPKVRQVIARHHREKIADVLMAEWPFTTLTK
jgi:DNA (cytosine-5)-methyltransferase 1